jgi:formate hydrogenlyase subunit 3/multisubunit Na+/H+ antiporter MnhD subunit
MISVMMLLVVATVFAMVVVAMLNYHRHLPPSHFAVASMRASPLLRRRRSQRGRST